MKRRGVLEDEAREGLQEELRAGDDEARKELQEESRAGNDEVQEELQEKLRAEMLLALRS